MSWTRSNVMVLGLLAVIALPLGASVKLMNLQEYMEITVDTVQGHIVAKETFRSDWPEEHTFYTQLTIEGESVRLGGEPRTWEVVFMGSHDPKDGFYHSEAPALKDVRLGNEVLVFFARQEEATGRLAGANYIWSHDGVYRVERGFGQPVVIGKGEGFAFPQNVSLDEARARIADTHKLIEAKRLAEQAAEAK